MKIISNKNASILLMLFTFLGCKELLEQDTPIYFDNQSNKIIQLYIPLVGMDGVVYPDTTLKIQKMNIGYNTLPGQRAYAGISNISIEKWISSFSKDTVSIFIFSKDTLDKYPWENIQQDYKILQRYDFSAEDIKSLYNKDDIPVIPYPPTEAMRCMKMYPPYGK